MTMKQTMCEFVHGMSCEEVCDFLGKLVRCRDCKFCDNDVFAYWCCREKYREFEVDSLDGECMGFCAWGVRRES